MIYHSKPVDEGESCLIGWTFKDENGVPVTLAQLGTLTWTHYNESTGLVINNRTAVDIKNVNGGTYHATSGRGTLTIPPADNIIVIPNVSEWHVAFIKGTYNGGAGVVEEEIAFRVMNLVHAP